VIKLTACCCQEQAGFVLEYDISTNINIDSTPRRVFLGKYNTVHMTLGSYKVSCHLYILSALRLPRQPMCT